NGPVGHGRTILFGLAVAPRRSLPEARGSSKGWSASGRPTFGRCGGSRMERVTEDRPLRRRRKRRRSLANSAGRWPGPGDAIGNVACRCQREGVARPGRGEAAAGALERTRHEFHPEEAVTLYRPRQVERDGERWTKTEAGVVGRVADEHHSAMAGHRRLVQRLAHQAAADAKRPALRCHGERTEQQCRTAVAGCHVPQPHGAGQIAVLVHSGERQGRKPALAQPLAGLLEARRTKYAVEQRLPSAVLPRRLVTDVD